MVLLQINSKKYQRKTGVFLAPNESLVHTADLSGAWDLPSMRDAMLDRLKELGIYREGLLYMGFDASRGIEDILSEGTFKPGDPIVQCSTENELAPDDRSDLPSAVDYATHFEHPGMAVYDGAQLYQPDDGGRYGYRALEGYSLRSALIGILELKMP